ncbi:MAG: ORF6C domain-containing protein [Vagococcus sp.]|uniref:ORF6C domain-containing protein n=1 Tax=Vagococcus sp. TaxID=1933889 RepID=UPI002FC9A30F
MSNQLMDLQKQLENQLVIVKEMQVMKEDMTKMHTEIKQDVQELRDTITLTDSERSNLQSAVQTKANELTKKYFKKDVSDDLFLMKSGHFRSVIYKRIKDTFNITSYYKVRRIDFKHAMQVIEMVQLSNLKGYQLRLTPRQKEIALLNGDDIKEFEQEV